MVKQLSTKFVNYLIVLSGMDVHDEDMEVYIYGLECFFNTFVTFILLSLWGCITHTLLLTWLWVVAFSFLRKFIGGAHAPTQISCIISSVILGCMNQWAILNVNQSIGSYILCICLCVILAPHHNSKLSLSQKQRWKYKLASIIIICIGMYSYAVLGSSNITSTIHYAYLCGCTLLLVAFIRRWQTEKVRWLKNIGQQD
ncbi:MAG: accessory gene regulator B family protein [Acetatifactor sp.]|nr:accessory gene regulator B family protein [Acetatifactor sp.]